MPDLCPVCLRKLLFATKSESAQAVRMRYQQLSQFFAEQPESFPAHLAWVQSRLGDAPAALSKPTTLESAGQAIGRDDLSELKETGQHEQSVQPQMPEMPEMPLPLPSGEDAEEALLHAAVCAPCEEGY